MPWLVSLARLASNSSKHDTDLGEEHRLGVDLVPAEHSRSHHDAGQDLADHRRLPQPLEDLVPDLRGEQQNEELTQHVGDVVHRSLQQVAKP